MINYISSEIYRAKKRKFIIGLLIAGIIIPAIVYSGNSQNIEEFSGRQLDVLMSLGFILQPAAAVLGLVLVAFVYKKEEIYRIYLSQGLTKFQVFLYDLMSLETLTVLIGLMLFGVVVAVSGILSLVGDINHLKNLDYFFGLFLKALVIQLVVNTFLLSVSYLTNSKVIGISVFFIVFFLFLIFQDTEPNNLITMLIYELNPYRLNNKGFIPRKLNLKDLFYIIRYVSVNIYLGYFGIRKREF